MRALFAWKSCSVRVSRQSAPMVTSSAASTRTRVWRSSTGTAPPVWSPWGTSNPCWHLITALNYGTQLKHSVTALFTALNHGTQYGTQLRRAFPGIQILKKSDFGPMPSNSTILVRFFPAGSTLETMAYLPVLELVKKVLKHMIK